MFCIVMLRAFFFLFPSAGGRASSLKVIHQIVQGMKNKVTHLKHIFEQMIIISIPDQALALKLPNRDIYFQRIKGSR